VVAVMWWLGWQEFVLPASAQSAQLGPSAASTAPAWGRCATAVLEWPPRPPSLTCYRGARVGTRRV
jgi:hypothetical protein